MKSSEADVISQIPKPKFLTCSVDGKRTTELSQTERASIEESKNKVASVFRHAQCPISVEKNSVLA